mgnify:CR=1 FL=1
MDVLTQVRLMVLGAWVILAALTLGPALGLSWLLDFRDRRQARLLGTAFEQLSASGVRERVAVRARCALFSQQSVVTIDMNACSREEIWDTIARLSRRFPPHVRLVVDGMGDRQLPVTLTVKTGDLLSRPSRPFAVSA